MTSRAFLEIAWGKTPLTFQLRRIFILIWNPYIRVLTYNYFTFSKTTKRLSLGEKCDKLTKGYWKEGFSYLGRNRSWWKDSDPFLELSWLIDSYCKVPSVNPPLLSNPPCSVDLFSCRRAKREDTRILIKLAIGSSNSYLIIFRR